MFVRSFVLTVAFMVSCSEGTAVAVVSNSKRSSENENTLVLSKNSLESLQHSLQTSPVFANVTTEEEAREVLLKVLEWEPPAYILENFPYYHAGATLDGNPLWIVEAGKFDIVALVGQGPEIVEAIDVYLLQAFLRAVISSSKENAPQDPQDNRFDVLVDFDGLQLSQIGTPAALALILKMAQRYKHFLDQFIGEAVIINANFVVESLIRMVRPVLGRIFERIDTYGSNKSKWLPRLQHVYPSSAIPPWYGGSKDFRPIAVYG